MKKKILNREYLIAKIEDFILNKNLSEIFKSRENVNVAIINVESSNHKLINKIITKFENKTILIDKSNSIDKFSVFDCNQLELDDFVQENRFLSKDLVLDRAYISNPYMHWFSTIPIESLVDKILIKTINSDSPKDKLQSYKNLIKPFFALKKDLVSKIPINDIREVLVPFLKEEGNNDFKISIIKRYPFLYKELGIYLDDKGRKKAIPYLI